MKQIRKIIALVFVLFLASCGMSSQAVPQVRISNLNFNDDFSSVTFDLSVSDKSNVLTRLSYTIEEEDVFFGEVELISDSKQMDLTKSSQETISNLTKDFHYKISVYGDYQIGKVQMESALLKEYIFEANASYDNFCKLLSETYHYDGQMHSLEVINLPENATVTYTNNEQTLPGVYEIQADVFQGTKIIESFTATLTILKLVPTLSFIDQEIPYTGNPIVPTYDLSNSGPVEILYNGKKEAPVAVGTYSVSISYAGNSIYESVQKTATLTISPANIEVSLASFYDIDDGKTHEIEPIFSMEPEEYEIACYQNNIAVELDAVGQYEVKISIPGSSNYHESTHYFIYTIVPNDEFFDDNQENLMISELVFSNENKNAIELFNPTNKPIDLSTYTLVLERNGYQTTILFPKDILSPLKTKTISAEQNPYRFNLSFDYFSRSLDVLSFDTIISLKNEDTLVDFYDGSFQSLNSNLSLIRKCYILKGNTEFIEEEWIHESIEDVMKSLNQHVMLEASLAYPSISIYEQKHIFNYGEELDLSKYINVSDLVDIYLTTKDLTTFEEFDYELLGTQDVLLTLKNSIGNEITVPFSFEMKDITGPEVEKGAELFKFALNAPMPNFTTLFAVSDNYDGPIAITQEMITFNNVNMHQAGTYSVSYHFTDSNQNETNFTTTIVVGNNYDLLTDYKTYKEVSKAPYMPAKGNLHTLVVPIAFPEYASNFSMYYQILDAFNSMDTNKMSVKRYYNLASYGLLNINFTVTSWYKPNYNHTYYAKLKNPSEVLLNEVLQNFDKTINYKDYDSDSDSFIDGIYLLYNSPADLRENGNFHTTTKQANLEGSFDDVKAGYYTFMSLDFIKLSNYPYIHETAKQLGLSDYVSKNSQYALGGTSLLDFGIGDLPSFAKLQLGWINPYLVTESTIVEINSFQAFGDAILVTTNYTSIFDEYFLIDLYTKDEASKTSFGEAKYGVRIYHVCAELNQNKEFSNNNYKESYPLLRLMEKDYKGSFDFEYSSFARESDLYEEGDIFGDSYYQNYTLSDGHSLPFEIQILDCKEQNAKVLILFK